MTDTVTSTDLLADAFGRIRETVLEVLDGLDEEQLAERVGPHANPIGWLVWHLTRIQDDHVADVAGTEHVWTGDGWYERFGLPYPPSAHGYGQSSRQVGQFRGVSAELLAGYHEAVHARTVAFLDGLKASELSRIVDDSWDPPVTLAVRLVSVVADDLQHVGQAAYVRGLLSG
ncbi:mycothiol transferase [Streptacidiphilus monticola]|uniref:DUF664 domain-containing protein n=1 Tax=Streptacidiphilus monticola TaxID=2161674 RepID=A0ABW1FWH4_9ACTN